MPSVTKHNKSTHQRSRLRKLEQPRPVRRDILALPPVFGLVNGGCISTGNIAYTLYGDAKNPWVLVLGGISAGRDVAHLTPDYASGWWSPHVGFGQSIDLETYCVLGIDYLGGNGQSSAPDPSDRHSENSITTQDQASAIAWLISQLAKNASLRVIGSSYGGMVALALAHQNPSLVSQVLTISAAHQSNPLGTAFRSLQRQIAQLLVADSEQDKCLSLARSLAMLTYRSHNEIDTRFIGKNFVDHNGFHAPISDYLLARGKEFSEHFDTTAFCRLSESIDLHIVPPEDLEVPLTCVAVNEDQLIPRELIQQLCLKANGNFIEINSNFGHDAFLKEVASIAWIITRFLRGAIL